MPECAIAQLQLRPQLRREFFEYNKTQNTYDVRTRIPINVYLCYTYTCTRTRRCYSYALDKILHDQLLNDHVFSFSIIIIVLIVLNSRVRRRMYVRAVPTFTRIRSAGAPAKSHYSYYQCNILVHNYYVNTNIKYPATIDHLNIFIFT